MSHVQTRAGIQALIIIPDINDFLSFSAAKSVPSGVRHLHHKTPLLFTDPRVVGLR